MTTDQIPPTAFLRHPLPRRVFLSTSVAAATVGAAGCGFGNSTSPQANKKSAPGGSQAPGQGSAQGLTDTFRMATRPVNHLNPAFTGQGSPQGTWLMSLMWEGLVNRQPGDTKKFVPGQADKWEMSQDALTYTFHLRDGSTWANGDPLTAHDFVWTFSYYYSPKLAKQGNQNPPNYNGSPESTTIKGLSDYYAGKSTDFSTVGVAAKDDQTLEFTLTAPDYKFMDGLVHTYPLHQKSVEAHVKDFWLPANLVGNGPYVLTKYTQNSDASFELNEKYYNADKFTIKHRPVQFNSAGSTGMMVSYNADEIDLFRVDGDPTALIAGRKELAKQLQRATMIQFQGLSVMPCQNPILQKSQKLRQALSMALDRDALAKVSPPYVAAESWAPSGISGYDKLPKLVFDPEQAKKLMAEAGYADGKGVPHLQISTYSTMPFLEAACSMWRDHLGVSASVKISEVGIFTQTLYGDIPADFTGFTFNYRGISPAMMLGLVGGNFNNYNYVPYDTAHQWYDLTKGKDKNKYPPAETQQRALALLQKNWLPEYRSYDKLAKQAVAAQADPEKSLALSIKAATALQDSYLFMPLLWAGYAFMVKPRVHDLVLNSLSDSMFTLAGVTLDPVKS